MDDALAYLLALRLRVRGRPEAMAIVDRALAIVGRLRDAPPQELEALERDIEALSQTLGLRFGERSFTLH